MFQTMTTLRRDLPLSIQEDMSMHSALSFHRRESHYLNLNNFHILAEKKSKPLFIDLLVYAADLWLPLSKGSMAAYAIG